MGLDDLYSGDILINQRHTGIAYKDLTNNSIYVIHISSMRNGIVCSSIEEFMHECGADNVEIFRHSNSAQVEKAVTFAYKTAKQGSIHYDWGRLMSANFFSEQLIEAKKQFQINDLALLHETFALSGFFRAIKYASRRNQHLIKSTDVTHKHGLRCAFFVCLCYQIAALEDYVEPINYSNAENWISNKHIDKTQMAELRQLMPTTIYEKYKLFLKKPLLVVENGKLMQKENKQIPNEQPKYQHSALKRLHTKQSETHNVYKPALFQWRNKEEINSFITSGKCEQQLSKAMLVDAKYCTARDLLTLLKSDKEYWQAKGLLEISVTPTMKVT